MKSKIFFLKSYQVYQFFNLIRYEEQKMENIYYEDIKAFSEQLSDKIPSVKYIP